MSGLDRLVGGAGMRDVYGEARETWGASHPGFAFDEDVAGSVIDSRVRDAAWCERELGDVPYDRVAWDTCTWAQGMDRPGELVRATDGTLGRLGAGVTLRD